MATFSIPWDCPECCGEVCSSPCNCENPFGTQTTVTGNLEVTFTGLPPFIKSSITKTIENVTFTVYDGYSVMSTGNANWYGLLRKEQNDETCSLEDTSSSDSHDDIYRSDFLLSGDSYKRCHTNNNGVQKCYCLGISMNRLGRESLYLRGDQQRISDLDCKFQFVIRLNTAPSEYVDFEFPIYRISNNDMSYRKLSIRLDHVLGSIGNCGSENTIYHSTKGYCYTEWLEGFTILLPMTYAVSGYLSCANHTDSYTSDRATHIQNYLSQLSARGYACTQTGNSKTNWDISYAENLTTAVNFQFTPLEAVSS